jgi:hypothetical protein
MTAPAAERVLAGLHQPFPAIRLLWADTAYRGLADWLAAQLGWSLEITRHWWTGARVWVAADQPPPERPAGFQVLKRRWVVEVVFPQMTKADVLALGAGGQHVADLDLSIGDDHPVDEQQHELPVLLEARRGQALLHAGAESLQRRRHAGELLPARHVVAQQLLLAGQNPQALLQVTAAPLVLVERENRPKIGVGEPLELLGKLRLGMAQRLAARLQLLRQPCPAMGTRDRGGERLRLGQQGAEYSATIRVRCATIRMVAYPAGSGGTRA